MSPVDTVLQFTTNDDGTVSVDRWSDKILIEVAMLKETNPDLVRYDGEFVEFVTREGTARYKVLGSDFMGSGIVIGQLVDVGLS